MVVDPVNTSLIVSRAYGGAPAFAVPLPVEPTYLPRNAHPDAITGVTGVAAVARINDRLGRFVDRYA